MNWNQTYRNIIIHCDTSVSFVVGNPVPTLLTHAVAIIGGQQRHGTLDEIKTLIDSWKDDASSALDHNNGVPNVVKLDSNEMQ
jgi:hypothetical protein